jgi:hypothetical protein
MKIQDNKAVSGGGDFTTSASEIVPVLSHYKTEPDQYWALPGPGQELQGLKRGVLYGLIRDREIISVSVRRRGRLRGRRLILASSLIRYLNRLREEQNPKEEAK